MNTFETYLSDKFKLMKRHYRKRFYLDLRFFYCHYGSWKQKKIFFTTKDKISTEKFYSNKYNILNLRFIR